MKLLGGPEQNGRELERGSSSCRCSLPAITHMLHVFLTALVEWY